MVEVQLMQWGMAILARTETNSRVQRRGSYRAGGIRTRGLLHPRQALYQAEPQPELIAHRRSKRGANIYFAYYGRGGKVEYASNSGQRRGQRFRFAAIDWIGSSASRPLEAGLGSATPAAAGQKEKAHEYLRRAPETNLLPEEKALVAKEESTLQ